MIIALVIVCITLIIVCMILKTCKHTFEIYKEISVYNGYSEGKLPVRRDVVLRCTKCGRLEVKKV